MKGMCLWPKPTELFLCSYVATLALKYLKNQHISCVLPKVFGIDLRLQSDIKSRHQGYEEI